MSFGRRAATVAGAARATSGRHSLMQRISAVLPMLGDALVGRWRGAPRGRLLLSLVGIGYVLSPLDVIPELVLGPFGLMDDLAIAVASLAVLLGAADEWLDVRDSTASPSGATPTDGQSFKNDDVIVGVVIDRK